MGKFIPPFPFPDPIPTSSVRSSERDPNTAIPAGRDKPRAGSFLPCPMFPDPQIQIDLRDPPERMSDRIVPFRRPIPASPATAVRGAYDWRTDPRFDPTAHVDDDPDWEKLLEEQLKLDASDELYLVEEVASQVAEGVVEEEDDPERELELAYAEMIAREEAEDA